MAKVLNYLIGIIGILYICGQMTYYGLVQVLKVKGYAKAEMVADSHKFIFDWVILMALLLVILGCIALIANLVEFRIPRFKLRVFFSTVSIFMPFMHIKNHITIIIEMVFLILFGTYIYYINKSEKSELKNKI
ncbi:hypothetical protein [Ligilactobacillus cholophilus]|uniref:hypothetical protein n=1 Tax=Ligilactobacillus cholophilus TaxID=3050131 RepID=UPI0025B16757|nr:hypothetical protein [Ligilactobacillus cholophilus]